MKSALFVDFDNVYSGLRKLDQTTADRFALRPQEWMNWVIESLALPDHVRDGARRRLLVRRCYLNPQAYQRFRSAFNLAGFEIIDCPALTGEGKTSTDIHMVLDIVDLLQHEAHYEEFIVFSADADFTPVLRKLRRWDRRTTVLAIGFPSAAYRASADLLINQDEFMREALGFRDEEEAVQEPPPAPPLEKTEPVRAALDLIRQKVAESPDPVALAKLAALVLSNVEGIDAATWAGLGSFRGLLDSLDISPLCVKWEGGGNIYDPRRHTVPTASSPMVSATANGESEIGKVTALVRNEVAKATQPVPCGRLATLITAQHGALAADWNGKGMFRRFIESLDLAPIKFDWSSSGGCAYEPDRHSLLKNTGGDGFEDWGDDRDLLSVAKQVHEATDAPLLPPIKYRAVFDSLVDDLAVQPFNVVETGKRVRDRCRDCGQPVSRADVNFVLRGLLLRGHAFGQGQDDRQVLSRKLADNIRSLCLREQMVVDAVTDNAINRWIAGRA